MTRVSIALRPDCHSPATVTFVASFEKTRKVTLPSGKSSGETILAGILNAGLAAGGFAAGLAGSWAFDENVAMHNTRIVTFVTNTDFKLFFIIIPPEV
jgi:hypothetical protein